MEQIDQLLAADPTNADYRILAATAAVGLGQNEQAIELYRDMLRDFPQSWDVALWMGPVLKTLGRQREAIEAYRAAASARPDFGDAYWSLANLKLYRFEAEEMMRMDAAEAPRATDLVDRYHLCFALGKGLEDRGDAEEAWHYYERGNALRRSDSRYRPEVIE